VGTTHLSLMRWAVPGRPGIGLIGPGGGLLASPVRSPSVRYRGSTDAMSAARAISRLLMSSAAVSLPRRAAWQISGTARQRSRD
jgi:hypothetical protein